MNNTGVADRRSGKCYSFGNVVRTLGEFKIDTQHVDCGRTTMTETQPSSRSS